MQEKCLVLREIFETKYLVDPYSTFIREMLRAIEDTTIDVSEMWWERVRDAILDARGHSIVLDVAGCGISKKVMLYLAGVAYMGQCKVIDSEDSVRNMLLLHRYNKVKFKLEKVTKPPISIEDIQNFLTKLRSFGEVDLTILSETHTALVVLCMMCVPDVTIYIQPERVFQYMNDLFRDYVDDYENFYYLYSSKAGEYIMEATRNGDMNTLAEEYVEIPFSTFSQKYSCVPKDYFDKGVAVNEVKVALEKIYIDAKNELRNNDITFQDILGGLVWQQSP